jgi:hypothetical protein
VVDNNDVEISHLNAGFYLVQVVDKTGSTYEVIRHVIQNKFAHDLLTSGKSKHFRRLPAGYPGSFYGGSYYTNAFSIWE